MTNWCENELTITFESSPDGLLDALLTTESNGTARVDFGKTAPEPEWTEADGNACYDWRIANWGAKWNAAETHALAVGEESISVCFDTAGGPPVAWAGHLAKRLPDVALELSYYESGCEQAGEVIFRNGIATEVTELSPIEWHVRREFDPETIMLLVVEEDYDGLVQLLGLEDVGGEVLSLFEDWLQGEADEDLELAPFDGDDDEREELLEILHSHPNWKGLGTEPSLIAG